MGIDTILASISSRNDGSRRFHHRHGFEQAKCFLKVECKHGQDFDVAWMQKRMAFSHANPGRSTKHLTPAEGQ
ncbi:hypothetical protein DFAR_2150009 [Desulfarculales bacterium]